MINALATADQRARGEVRELLASKDVTIQELQAQLEKAKSSLFRRGSVRKRRRKRNVTTLQFQIRTG